MAWQDYWSGRRNEDDEPLVPEPNTGTPLNPAWLREGQTGVYRRPGYQAPPVPGAGRVVIGAGPGPLPPSAEDIGNASLEQRRMEAIRKAREIAGMQNPARTDDTGGQLEDLVRYSTTRGRAGLQEGQVHRLIDSLYSKVAEQREMTDAQRAAKMTALRNQAGEPSYQDRQSAEQAQWESRHAAAEAAEQKQWEARQAAAATADVAGQKQWEARQAAEQKQWEARQALSATAEQKQWEAQQAAIDAARQRTESRAAEAKNDAGYEQALGLADFTEQLAAGGTDLARAGADDTREAIFKAAPLMARAHEQAQAEYPALLQQAEALEAASQKGSPEYMALAQRGAMMERVMRKAPAALQKLSDLRARIEHGQRAQAEAAAATKAAPREMTPEQKAMAEARLQAQKESALATAMRNRRDAGQGAAQMAAARKIHSKDFGNWLGASDWLGNEDPQSQIEALLLEYSRGETLTPEEASTVRVYLQSLSGAGSPASGADEQLENTVPQ